MQTTVMIIDGYNVIHKIPELEEQLDNSLLSAREGLVQFCSNWRECRKDIWKFILVFDGSSSVQHSPGPAAQGVESVYSLSGHSADSLIIEMVRTRGNTGECIVVSDDNYVRRESKEFGAAIMDISEFCRTFNNSRNKFNRSAGTADKNGLSEKESRTITDDLMSRWGDL